MWSNPVLPEGRWQADRRPRPVAALLSLALLVLLGWLLLTMGAFTPDRPGEHHNLVAIKIQTDSGAQHVQKAVTHPRAAPPRHQPVPPHPVPAPVVKPPVPPAFIHLSHSDMASADISKMSRSSDQSGDQDSSQDSGKTYGPGEGPSGRHLYNAEWYREPSDAEMTTYLPAERPPGSWGMIACKTIEHYHVENCQELDESPPGSGIARALRLASWQFLVRPPRVNGAPQLGAWVRIRFDFTRGVH
jgi:protein TonB